MLRLLKNEIEDPKVQENFQRLEDFLRDFPLSNGVFKFFVLALTAASYPATVRVPHTLGFAPKDVLQTSVIGSGSVTWVYSQFTKSELVLSISGPVTVRAFVGSYAEGRLA
jgi:hypothetical protein